MIYMKGVPDLPRCGFSALAVRVLKEYSKFAEIHYNAFFSTLLPHELKVNL